MSTTELINNAYKHVRQHLKALKWKDIKDLKKGRHFICYDIYGNYTNISKIDDGIININSLDIASKKDINRAVNLAQEEFELEIMKALQEKLNN